jgi:hypothetical protein
MNNASGHQQASKHLPKTPSGVCTQILRNQHREGRQRVFRDSRLIRTSRTSSGAILGAKWPGLLARSQSVRCRTSSTRRSCRPARRLLPSPVVHGRSWTGGSASTAAELGPRTGVDGGGQPSPDSQCVAPELKRGPTAADAVRRQGRNSAFDCSSAAAATPVHHTPYRAARGDPFSRGDCPGTR